MRSNAIDRARLARRGFHPAGLVSPTLIHTRLQPGDYDGGHKLHLTVSTVSLDAVARPEAKTVETVEQSLNRRFSHPVKTGCE